MKNLMPMNATKSRLYKFQMISALLVVFLLVLATNLMDNKHFKTVKESLTTMYEDRLVVIDIIYEIRNIIHLQQLSYFSEWHQLDAGKLQSASDRIDQLIDQFATTKLTTEESVFFDLLISQIAEVRQLESQFASLAEESKSSTVYDDLESRFEKLNRTLDALSQIQLKEGKNQLSFSEKAVRDSSLMSKFEIGFLVLIGIILQVIIFYNPKRKSQ
jgi:hypothetical protein